jgi:hypothetical protein
MGLFSKFSHNDRSSSNRHGKTGVSRRKERKTSGLVDGEGSSASERLQALAGAARLPTPRYREREQTMPDDPGSERIPQKERMSESQQHMIANPVAESMGSSSRGEYVLPTLPLGSSMLDWAKDEENQFNVTSGASRQHYTHNAITVAPEMIGHLNFPHFHATDAANAGQNAKSLSPPRAQFENDLVHGWSTVPWENTVSNNSVPQGASSSKYTGGKYTPQKIGAGLLMSSTSKPNSSPTSQSESYYERSKRETTGRENPKLSNAEYLVKAALQADRVMVSSSSDIPKTKAEAESHIEIIRNGKRDNDGGRNAKDLEAALEL